MVEVYVIGAYATAFDKWPQKSHRDLGHESVTGALADAELPSDVTIDQIWFANCAMGVFGQENIRGQVCLSPLVENGIITPNAPIINVEGGCATGSLAFHGAYKDIMSQQSQLTLAVGVEKTLVPDDPMKTFGLFAGGIDQINSQEWKSYYATKGEECGSPFTPHPARIVFLDIHSMMAHRHIQKYGTTVQQIAQVAAKNHTHGSMNPKAQYRHVMTAADVLEDKPVISPLTRSMCAPISDGAAAVLLCSGEYLSNCDPTVQRRAVRVRASALAGGRYRDFDSESVTAIAAKKAYSIAGLNPQQIDIAEVHDATSFCEIQHTEDLGFCEPGQGGPLASSGATSLGGQLPINLSGGLISKGHPLGATGLGMIEELVLQLRGEAGERQANAPKLALQHNAGGMVGLDEALCSVSILEKS